MGVEIERKFLVVGEFKNLAKSQNEIAQGYLSSIPERTVRVRIKGDKGFLTIKGKSTNHGLQRFEWEKEIPVSEAKELLLLCEKGVIEKTRYIVDYKGFVIEVDVFKGENKGLVLAEIELDSVNENPDIPEWLGKEVTGNEKYYNSYLSKYPFQSWE